MELSAVLIIATGCVGFVMGYLAAVLRHGDTKEGTTSASHNKQSAQCIKCGYPLNAKGQCLNGVCDLCGV